MVKHTFNRLLSVISAFAEYADNKMSANVNTSAVERYKVLKDVKASINQKELTELRKFEKELRRSWYEEL